MNIESLETSSQFTSEHVASAYRAKLAELTDSIVSSSAKEAKQTLEEFQLKYGTFLSMFSTMLSVVLFLSMRELDQKLQRTLEMC